MAKQNKKQEADQSMAPKGYVPALKKLYKEEIVDALVKKFGYTTPMVTSKIPLTRRKAPTTGSVEDSAEELSRIMVRRLSSSLPARTFQLQTRKGMPVGVKVTLRHQTTSSKDSCVALPASATSTRIRPMDGQQLHTGIKEQLIFPRWRLTRTPLRFESASQTTADTE